MALATIDRTPPPFFRQGLSALTKLALFAALAVFLMAADRRLALVEPLRATLATALLPLQRALAVPVQLAASVGSHLQGLRQAIANEEAARAKLVALSARAARVDVLTAENSHLRALLDLRAGSELRAQPAEALYEASDIFSRKIVVDRGANHGVVAGSPVIDEAGVVGQVTRVYPLTSIVTLLADKDASIPVFNTRTQQRGAAFGGAEGGMELRYLAANADVQVGDMLVTGGIDGVYPQGLAVARITRVDRRSEAGFARVLAAPVASLDAVRHVLVVEPVGRQLPPRPQDPPAEASKPSKAAKGASR